MAKPSLRETGVGLISAPPEIKLDADGKLTEDQLLTLNDYLRTLSQKFRYISFGNSTRYARMGNLDAQRIEFTTPSVADTEFALDHSLSRTPAGVIPVLQNKAASVYTSNFGGWNEDTIYLKCDTASVLFNFMIF